MTNPSNAVARRQPDTDDAPKVVNLMERQRDAIISVLPEGVSFERVMTEVRIALAKAPDLRKCDPGSIVLAVAQIQRWGLSIGETAHLVPFGGVCTPLRDYKGDIELAIASGAARKIDAHCVYANEEFRNVGGLNPELYHVPLSPSARGPMIGAYAIIWQTYTRATAQFMWLEEIDAIRGKYSKSWKAGPCPAWYAKKTAIRQALKLVPKNPRLAALLRKMDDDDAVMPIVAHIPANVDADGVDLSAPSETPEVEPDFSNAPFPDDLPLAGNE